MRGTRFTLPRVALIVLVAAAITTGALPATAASAPVQPASTSLGKVLVNSKGRTVYVFAADPKGKSTCRGACAAAWPPVIVSSKNVGKPDGGAARLGTITRSDGRLQLTVNGRPVYTFTGDSAKGDVNGQGIDGFGARWWVVGPNGARITKVATAAPTPAPDPTLPPDYGY